MSAAEVPVVLGILDEAKAAEEAEPTAARSSCGADDVVVGRTTDGSAAEEAHMRLHRPTRTT